MPRYVFLDDLHPPYGDIIILFCVNTSCVGANDAHSDDTSRLKVAVGHWVNASIQESSTNDTSNLLDPTTQERRGINNDVTGRLLCPINYDWDDPSCVTCSNFFLTIA